MEDSPRKYLHQLINREQHFVSALQFGVQRFASPLQERRDLISPTDHRTLFQNIEEIVRLSEDIIEQMVSDDHEPSILFASRVYLSKSTTICAAYKKYCNGIKRADCVLVNKSRQSSSDFVSFITVPQVPRKRPDLTTFIHRPLQHFREILKLIITIASDCRPDSEECKNFTSVISALQTTYREVTVGEGLMDPIGEGRPLLTLQDLEARLVFTKCKPFVLAVPGRQWIFGKPNRIAAATTATHSLRPLRWRPHSNRGTVHEALLDAPLQRHPPLRQGEPRPGPVHHRGAAAAGEHRRLRLQHSQET